jgi:lysyl-tRNA synthetase, class II
MSEFFTRARELVQWHGEDSISPFLLRPDKSLYFAHGAVLGYRLLGRTAVVSGDPVGPEDATQDAVGSFLSTAGARGWRVVFYGASGRWLDTYRDLGLRALCVGEEAVVDPARFTLEGRRVRKLRQSVQRVARRGWAVLVLEGHEIDADLEVEIEAVEREWRAGQDRLLGFAMAMGAFEAPAMPDDLYLLARAPGGHLQAVMRLISHCGKLSLDTAHRVGETPNGLCEAMVCRALEVARERGIAEVSLNYAGLAHLIRNPPTGWRGRWLGWLLGVLGRRFQMQRLVGFNQKFTPQWRPRYLVYESRRSLPVAVLRVLQAEGYLGVGPTQPPLERSLRWTWPRFGWPV